MSEFKKCLYTQDLLLLVILSLMSIIFILVSPFNETPLRILFALLLIFFIPGYAFISALFPGNREISGIERFTLSVGFSIVIFIFDGFVVSVTEWKFRPDSITISLVLLTVLFVILTYLSRRRLPPEEQFTFSFNGFISSVMSDDLECATNIVPDEPGSQNNGNVNGNGKRFSAKKRSKVSSVYKKKDCKPSDEEDIYGISPQIIRALMIAMVLSIIVAGAMFAYAKVNREESQFTALYILGPDGKAENYPQNISTSDPARLIAGIHNHETESANYILQVKFDDILIEEIEVTLDHKEKWEQELVITPSRFREGRQKLEFALYRNEVGFFPYRSVHLWLIQQFPTETIDTPDHGTIDFVFIENADMGSDIGWEFVSTHETMAEGDYQEGSGVHGSRAFVINSTYEGNPETSGFAQHALQQEVYSDRRQDVLLSAYLKGNYITGTPEGAQSQFKRVSFNGEVVWSDVLNGDKGLQRLQVPVTIQEGQNTLSFVLAQNLNMEIQPSELMIDEVSFMPVSAMSPYLRSDYTIETEPPVSWVDPLPPVVSDNRFTVTWNGTDEGSGIYYFNIDYSTDGTNWRSWLSKTTATSAEFEGRQGQTYYFRSWAVDNALNREEARSTADTSTTIDSAAPQLSLRIPPNPTNDTIRTNLILTSDKPLTEVQCLLVSQTFGVSERPEFSTNDGLKWTARHTLGMQDTYFVEITAKDQADNIAYALDTIRTDAELEELTITTHSEKESGYVEIRVQSSAPLRVEPDVVVRDRTGYVMDVQFDSYDGNRYIYKATVDDAVQTGRNARITADATTTDSQNLYRERTFTIDSDVRE